MLQMNPPRWPKLALLSYSTHVQRAKFRPKIKNVRFCSTKLKPQARKQNERVCLLSHSNSRSGPP